MFVVIFEVRPRPQRWADYLDTAALLRPELERIAGFVSNERFRDRCHPGAVLSLSTWQDEKALIRWRAHGGHHLAGQTRGRSEIFQDYRLRVGEVTLDSDLAGGVAPDQVRFDHTAVGVTPVVTVTERGAAAGPETQLPEAVLERASYDSLRDPGRRVTVATWSDAAAAAAWTGWGGPGRHRVVRVIREYGLRDRREAPQYFPEPG